MPSFQQTFVHTRSLSHETTVAQLECLAGRNRLLRQLGEAAWNPAFPWVGLGTTASEKLLALASVISSALTCDCVAVEYHTVSDSIAYHYVSQGRHRRSLVCGFVEEGLWELVQGEPVGWESALAVQPALGSYQPALGAGSFAEYVLAFHHLPPTWDIQRRFGPPWPLRFAPLFWRHSRRAA
jgi:hypothetical protein